MSSRLRTMPATLLQFTTAGDFGAEINHSRGCAHTIRLLPCHHPDNFLILIKDFITPQED